MTLHFYFSENTIIEMQNNEGCITISHIYLVTEVNYNKGSKSFYNYKYIIIKYRVFQKNRPQNHLFSHYYYFLSYRWKSMKFQKYFG